MITSTGNSRIKAVSNLVKKSKARKEQGLFIVEGAKMFSELPRERLEAAYMSESFLKQLRQQGRDPEEFLRGSACETVTDEVMKYMSDTQTPQGILAVARQFSYTLGDVLAPGTAAPGMPEPGTVSSGASDGIGDSGSRNSPPHLVVLETIQDPGNLGTILRAGEGAGITGVVMNEGTADIYNPKVIRSTMGSIYRVPFVYVEDLPSAIGTVKKSGVRLYAAHLKGVSNYEEEDYTAATGFLIGNEANGLSGEIAGLADCWVKIPMAGRVESLNAAVAASVLMFEAARQRRRKDL